VPISIDPKELAELVLGSLAIFEALGGSKSILEEEQPTIDFAYACVVTTEEVKAGDNFTRDNTWVKRPGTGQIKAKDYGEVLGKRAANDIPVNTQVRWQDLAA
jgi:N-acetylneuraminate synthase